MADMFLIVESVSIGTHITEEVLATIDAPGLVTPRVYDKELRELVNALELFVENYRLMHAGTEYGPLVETAAAKVRAKLLEL